MLSNDNKFNHIINFAESKTSKFIWLNVIGYEPADLTMHPPPKRSGVGSFFSHNKLWKQGIFQNISIFPEHS